MSDTGATSAMAYCAACDQWRRCRDGLCESCRDAAKLAEQKDEIARLRDERDALAAAWPYTLAAGDLLTKAERERDDLRALLTRLRDWLAVLDAALGGRHV